MAEPVTPTTTEPTLIPEVVGVGELAERLDLPGWAGRYILYGPVPWRQWRRRDVVTRKR